MHLLVDNVHRDGAVVITEVDCLQSAIGRVRSLPVVQLPEICVHHLHLHFDFFIFILSLGNKYEREFTLLLINQAQYMLS